MAELLCRHVCAQVHVSSRWMDPQCGCCVQVRRSTSSFVPGGKGLGLRPSRPAGIQSTVRGFGGRTRIAPADAGGADALAQMKTNQAVRSPGESDPVLGSRGVRIPVRLGRGR